MLVARVEALPVVNPTPHVGGPGWMFVRLETDSGLVGYGEIFTTQAYLRPVTFAMVVEQVGQDFFVGRDPSHIERIYHAYYNSFYSHTGDLLKAAIFSGIECACWDVVGKELRRPVHELLGGRFRDDIRTYTYISAPPEQAGSGFEFWLDPGAVGDRAAELAEQGFTALKLDPFPLMTGSQVHYSQAVPLQWSPDSLDLAEQTIADIRRKVGPRCDVIVGTHGQMTVAGAIQVAQRLQRFNPMWFEEPVPPELPHEMARVARATSIPITAGERLTSKWEFARLIRADAAAILNLDVSQVGGLWEAKKIAAMAEANYLQIAPHVYGGPLVAAASVQLGLASPNLLITEGMGRFDGAHAKLLRDPIVWREGVIRPPDRPGIGYDLDEDVARSWAATEDDRLWGSVDSTSAESVSRPATVLQ